MPSAAEILSDVLPDKPMLTREELAEAIGFRVQSLASLTCKRQGPPMVKIGRAVRYPRQAALEWLARKAIIPTIL